MYNYVLGNNGARGPEALLLRANAVVGSVSMAYAGDIVAACNAAIECPADRGQVSALHDVAVELYAMLRQAIDTRERDGFTGKESDDSKRARQLLERAGAIASGFVA
jgi:hypothetical protein